MATLKTPHIYISAGETSGDMLGAQLAQHILKQQPYAKLTGMGGSRMGQAGVSLKFDANCLSVVGITEVIAKLPQIILTIRKIKRYIKIEKPDLVVLIDFPDTHLRIAKTAKKHNIPVLYYVSPQIWAWRASRISQIKKRVDHMAVLFPFEEKIYQDANIPVTFVGHHLKDTVKPSMPKSVAYRYFEFDKTKPIICLLPGSRAGEIKRHLSILIESAKKIKQEKPHAQFVLPIAPHLDQEKIKNELPDYIKSTKHHLYDILQITDAAIAVSGTVTLEVALMAVPFCIIYRVSNITYWLAKLLATVDQIGLCNIVANKLIAREFIQKEADPDNIVPETLKLLSDSSYKAQIQANQAALKASLGSGNASEKVAEIALNLI